MPEMSESTRRRFLQVAGTAAAATVLAPTALAAGRSKPVAVLARDSPLPVGPGAPYSSYQSEIYLSGMSLGVNPIFTTNLADLEDAAAAVLPEAARRHCSPRRVAPAPCGRTRGRCERGASSRGCSSTAKSATSA